MNVLNTEKGMVLNQNKYIERKVKEFEMTGCNNPRVPMEQGKVFENEATDRVLPYSQFRPV
jgi:hypothetical protein